MVQQVIIIGGGFGGLSAARALRGAAVRVTLVDKRNYHLFRPMLSASIAHEINQPLGAVVANGYASLRWLSPTLRKTFQLRDLYGLSTRDTAEIWG
jgi:cation diffusion facilitator CzcD-associated flavoprotein CzcO